MDAKVVTGLNGNDMHAILDEFAYEIQQDGDMTAKEMAQYWGIKPNAAHHRITDMLKAGRIEKIEGITSGGRKGYFYRPVKGE